MSRIENACPFEAQGRASQCGPCVSSNNGMPPCAIAYLGKAIPASNVVPLHRVEVLSARKAA